MSVRPARPSDDVDDAPSRPRRWPWFFAWLVVGAMFSLAVLGALTIGLFVLPFAALAAVLLAIRPGASAGLPGLVSGVGVLFLWVAFLNRSGPGNVCTATAGGNQCAEEWSPWPWLAIGLSLLASGAAVFVKQGRAVQRNGRHPR